VTVLGRPYHSLDASDGIASARTRAGAGRRSHARKARLSVASTPKLAPVTIVAVSNCPLMPVQDGGDAGELITDVDVMGALPARRDDGTDVRTNGPIVLTSTAGVGRR
jgi:hypothetical protein